MIRPLTLVGSMLLVLLSHGRGAAADVSAEVSLQATPQEVRVGETFRLEVRATVRGGDLQDVVLPDLKKYPELEILQHHVSRPMQFSFGLGSGVQVESSLTHRYAIRALSSGTFVFSPALARVDGKTYQSEPLTIVVRPNGAAVTQPQQPSAPPDLGDELSGARYDPRAFLRTVVSQDDVYLGQQVDVTVYLYTRLRVAGQSVNPTKTPMNGFWVYDERITSLEGSLVTVNGVQYRAYVLQRSAAFPQRTGELTIGAPRVSFDLGGMSLFDATDSVEREGVPVTVRVKPLPKPGPSEAVVGRYALHASLDRDTVQTGNAVTLRVEAKGDGNVQDLRLELPSIEGVRALQPTIRDEQRFDGDVLGGSRSWEWILIPEEPGQHVVPPLELSYFDPDAKSYDTARTPALAFASTGTAPTREPTISPAEPQTVEESPTFGPIRMYSALRRQVTPVRERPWFAWMIGFPPLLFLALTVGVSVRRRRRRRQATPAVVQRELQHQAEIALHEREPRGFYDKIVEAILHALETRLGDSIRGLANVALRERLIEAGFDDDLVGRVINELEGADFARFAASGVDVSEMEQCLRRTNTIVERIRRGGAKP